jgi:hypothetical protein
VALESKLQNRIRIYLERQKWVVHKVIRSSKPGWPDIEAFRCGQVLFIEAKSVGKKEKPLQLYRHQILRAQGFEVHTIDTWEQFINLGHIIN